jgi:hypothetical protein
MPLSCLSSNDPQLQFAFHLALFARMCSRFDLVILIRRHAMPLARGHLKSYIHQPTKTIS